MTITARLIDVPFAEAIRYFRAKLNLPTRTWTDLWQGMHARAFVVAGAMQASLIEDLRAAVDKALAEGTALAEFRRDFDATVAKHGWSYRGARGWRTRVIFQTNLRMAHAAGRWEQIQRQAATRPYLRYVATLDSRTRPLHREWHGTILPIAHSWWQAHMPPNGWNCRCMVTQLSARDLERRRLALAPDPAVEIERVAIRDADGATAIVETPRGIDPGFGYNVGEAAFGRGAQLLALEGHGKWAELVGPIPAAPPELIATPPRAQLGTRGRTEEEVRQALRDALGGDHVVIADPLGARVSVGQAIADHMFQAPLSGAPNLRRDGREAFFPFIREMIEDPAEIWVGFATSEESGRVALRRRYVSYLKLDGDTALALVADVDGNMWAGMTFFRGKLSGLRRMRGGVLAHRRGGIA